jgi:hypothetical protein
MSWELGVMRSWNRRPRWLLLYLIVPLGVGGLVLEHHLHLTQNGHKVVLLLIIVAVYGLMGMWVRSNATALQDLDGEAYRKQRRDPAVYGTPEFPTQAQYHYRETMALHDRLSSNEQKKR